MPNVRIEADPSDISEPFGKVTVDGKVVAGVRAMTTKIDGNCHDIIKAIITAVGHVADASIDLDPKRLDIRMDGDVMYTEIDGRRFKLVEDAPKDTGGDAFIRSRLSVCDNCGAQQMSRAQPGEAVICRNCGELTD